MGKANGQIDIFNKHRVNYLQRLPDFHVDLNRFPDNTVIVTEIVHLDKDGDADFWASQKRCSKQNIDVQARLNFKRFPLHAMAHDILMLEGELVEKKRYLERKKILKNFLEQHSFDRIRYVEPFDDGKPLYDGEPEGVVAKVVDSQYLHWKSQYWLKIKHWEDIECKVIGFTLGNGKRSNWFGSLVIVHDGICQKSGGGLNDADSQRVTAILRKAERTSTPFRTDYPYTAIKTDLKVEITYSCRTKYGKLREPRVKRVLYPNQPVLA